MEKEKTSLFKKWWFWLCVVVIVFAIIGIASENTNLQNNNTQTTSTPIQQKQETEEEKQARLQREAEEKAQREKEEKERKEQEEIERTKGKMTLDKFNRIQTGMTYQQVVDIVGGNGTVLSETDIGYSQYKTTIYQFEGVGSFGANANVTIQGGKVVSKAQFGLQ